MPISRLTEGQEEEETLWQYQVRKILMGSLRIRQILKRLYLLISEKINKNTSKGSGSGDEVYEEYSGSVSYTHLDVYKRQVLYM